MAALGVHDWNDKQEMLAKVFIFFSPVDLQCQLTTRSKLNPSQQLESFFGGQIHEDAIDNSKTCYDGKCANKVDTLVILSKDWGNLKESLTKEEANIESICITSPHGRRQRSLTPKRATRRSARDNDAALVRRHLKIIATKSLCVCASGHLNCCMKTASAMNMGIKISNKSQSTQKGFG